MLQTMNIILNERKKTSKRYVKDGLPDRLRDLAKSSVKRKILHSPAKVTVECMGKNLVITKSL